MLTRRVPAWAGVAIALGLAAAAAASVSWTPGAAEAALPARLTDTEFFQLIDTISEPNGSFRSDNLLSNEVWMQTVIPELTKGTKSGRVYMGVGPEQNFTYIAALQPKIAFIVDVRRGNLDLHLMYKALFELATDRADFVSRLFSKPRPEGLDKDSTVAAIFAAFANAESSETLFNTNLQAIADLYSSKHGHPLADGDRDGLEYVYRAFFDFGPEIQYSSTQRYSAGGLSWGRNQPSYADLMVATDADHVARGYLSTEERFGILKELETRNMLVPAVGNFGGPRAIRAVGTYFKDKHAVVSAFYLSNVEQYLRQDGLWNIFCANVAALPLDETSTFIRSVRGGQTGARYGFGLNSQLGRMAGEVSNCTP